MSKKQIKEGDREGECCTYIDMLPHKVCNRMTRQTYHSVFLAARLKPLNHPNRGERAASLVEFRKADLLPEFPNCHLMIYDRGGTTCRLKASNIAT